MRDSLRCASGAVGSAMVVACAWLLCGCAGTGSSGQTGASRYGAPVTASQAAPADHAVAPSRDSIRVGDRVLVRLTDIPNPPDMIDQRVREDGTITLLLGVQVQAAGKKAGELETDIYNAYVPKFYKGLTVTVKTEERVFYVDGEVRKPDRYIYAGELTVLKAISTAGGFTDFAKKGKVEVTRVSGGKPIVVDCVKAMRNSKLDIPIYPGDRIFVHKRIWF